MKRLDHLDTDGRIKVRLNTLYLCNWARTLEDAPPAYALIDQAQPAGELFTSVQRAMAEVMMQHTEALTEEFDDGEADDYDRDYHAIRSWRIQVENADTLEGLNEAGEVEVILVCRAILVTNIK